MRRKGSIVWIILTSVVMLTLGSAVLASDVSGALYHGNIEITNDGSTATNVAVPFLLSTQSLIDDDYIATNCSNTAILAGSSDTAYMPAPGATSNWMLFVPSIGDNSTLTDKLYTGGGDMSGKLRYFPGTGGMTTSDNASLELGYDFEIEQKGWIDTTSGSNKNLVYKEDAFKLYVNDTSSTRATIYDYQQAQIQDAKTSDVAAYGVNWYAQTVTASNNCGRGIGRVSLWLLKQGSPAGDITVSIRATSGGLPTGDDLTSEAISAGTIGGSQAYQDFTFDEPYAPASGTVYAIVVRVPAGDSNNYIRVYYNGSDVITGQYCSSGDSGASWSGDSAKDFRYKIYGLPIVTATGVSSGEHTVTTETGDLLWAPGNLVNYDNDGRMNPGAIHDNIPKLAVSMWFKLDADYGGGAANDRWFFYKQGGADIIALKLENGNGKLYYQQVGAGGFLLTSTTNTWSANTWHHIIVSMSDTGGGTQRLLVDGDLEDSDTQTAGNTPNGGDFYIGGLGNNGLQGEIANLSTFTDDLSTGEEADLYAGKVIGDENNLWYMDEGGGTTVIDYGGDSDDGTLTSIDWGTSTRPCKFAISVDGTGKDGYARPVPAVPDNSNGWTFLQNDVMLYMDYHKITISDVLKQHIIWENNASTFGDQSGNDHDATPTFRTTSSDADVSAELVSFRPIEEAEATSYSIEETANILSAAPDEIPHMYTELQTNHLPGAELINDALDAADIPQALFWFPFAFGASIIAGFVAYRVTSGKGKVQGSLLMQAIVSGVVLAFFSLMTGGGITGGVVPFWTVFIFAIEAFAVMIWSKQVTV